MPVNFQDLDQNQPQKPENRRIRIQENGRLVKDNSLPYDDCSGHWFWVFIFLFLRKIYFFFRRKYICFLPKNSKLGIYRSAVTT